MGVYARIVRTPGVAVLLLATLIGRLPIGISGLAILLYVRDVTGSFAVAGASAGALALGSALGAPLQGRLVDRRGPAMLMPLAVGHAAALLSIWAAGAAGGGTAALVAAALVAGLAIPPLTSVLRSRWPYLLADELELVPSAYALATSPPVMVPLAVLAGLPIAPLIASRSQLVERVAPPGTATEAFTWPITAMLSGISAGAAVSGAVIEADSWTTAVLVAVAVGLAGAAIVSGGRRTLMRPAVAPG